ncbi:hsp90 co-chaperone Cdc37-like [Tubulanus polymorphus]|uniref:hsp90 co-chaperone Cdc37-like n=1 Tax=Tubulanus polymorphus TaxID=672921 RepID=UPI003DA390F6
MSRLDYSKWDHIEISDDEDDTHPNVDTASLFRWKHQARVERMEEQKKKRETFEKGIADHQKKKVAIQQKIKEAEQNPSLSEQLDELKIKAAEIEKQEIDWKKKEDELKKQEKLTPWNVDTLCHDGKTRTVINKNTPKKKEELTEDEKAERLQKFVKENKSRIEKFGMMRKYEDSQEYLLQNRDLVCDESANHLVIWCINLQVEEKTSLMEHVAHQTIVMQFILQLAQSLDRDPRECIGPFFSRIKMAEKQYMEAFDDELDSFKERIRKRAQARIDEAVREYEEEERQKRLGPGGLDPQEVFESLPKELQECFEKKDIALLQEAITKFPKEEAEYHIKRCVDSGLWVPGESGESEPETQPAAES